MTSRKKFWVASGILLVGLGVGLSFAQPREEISPESLLPENSLLYIGYDGGAEHQQEWQETAAYEALYESGLMDVVTKLIGAVTAQTGGEQGIGGQISTALQHVMDHGISVAVTAGEGEAGPPVPWGIFVFHDAAMFEEGLSQLATGAARGEIEFETTERDGRSITHGLVPRSPGVELGWWTEGDHLVVVVGMAAVDSAIAVADGEANITDHALWDQYVASDPGFTRTTVGWLDFAGLRERFGEMPLPTRPSEARPEGVTINDVLEVTGLDGLNSIVGRSGYKGRALWSEVNIDAPGPRRGLLSLSEQETFTLEDLPPMPEDCKAFAATSYDWAQIYDTLYEVAVGAEQLFAPDETGRVEQTMAMVNEKIGFDLKTGLLEPLGNVHTGYADTAQGILGLGAGLVIAVDDADELRESMDKLLVVLQEEAGTDVDVERVDRDGRELVLVRFADSPFSPAYCIGEKWLAFGMVPQTVDAFLLREAGDLPAWQATAEHESALEEVPQEFTAITISDPRDTYEFLLGMAPFAVGGAQMALRQYEVMPLDFEFPISTADIPPSELVTRPLFPNVTVAEVSDDGVHYVSRVSLAGGGSMGAMDGGTAVATSAVAVALLLPAVQQAREAARRTASKNNLKQIMLALHNYHDVNLTFPEGTHPNEKLKPEERLSWITKILPFIDEVPLYSEIDFDQGWESKDNSYALEITIAILQNPSHSAEESDYATTHYVGLAGLGEDGPKLPVTSEKAGVFAYNRGTRIRDIRDGTSNTIAISDATDPGPWGAGGSATIRPLTEKPYINGPDGIGGPHEGGIQVGMCDGSVRFVSENIDPSVMEALVTINGGEVVSDF